MLLLFPLDPSNGSLPLPSSPVVRVGDGGIPCPLEVVSPALCPVPEEDIQLVSVGKDSVNSGLESVSGVMMGWLKSGLLPSVCATSLQSKFSNHGHEVAHEDIDVDALAGGGKRFMLGRPLGRLAL